jgi:hypothetical protein
MGNRLKSRKARKSRCFPRFAMLAGISKNAVQDPVVNPAFRLGPTSMANRLIAGGLSSPGYHEIMLGGAV